MLRRHRLRSEPGRGSQQPRGGVPFPVIPRWIEEDDPELRAGIFELRQELRRVPRQDAERIHPEALRIPLDPPAHPERPLDEHAVPRTARQRFEAERTDAGAEVEHPGTGQLLGQHREEALAEPRRGRPEAAGPGAPSRRLRGRPEPVRRSPCPQMRRP